MKREVGQLIMRLGRRVGFKLKASRFSLSRQVETDMGIQIYHSLQTDPDLEVMKTLNDFEGKLHGENTVSKALDWHMWVGWKSCAEGLSWGAS